MANTKAKLALLEKLHKQQEDLYAAKNEKYDDAFAKTYGEYGPTVALVRLEDKLNRAKSLVKAGLDDVNGWSLVDTLTDMANYANMFLIELAGPEDFPQPEKNRSRKNKTHPKAENTETEEKEEGPLDSLSKAELVRVLEELGETVPKKCNRRKLYSLIQNHPLVEVATAITAVKPEGPVGDEGDEAE